MKIAYLSFPSLADSDIPLVQELLRQQHDVVYYLVCTPHTPLTISHLDRYLPARRIVVTTLPVAHDWHPRSIAAIVYLWQQLRQGEYDVIHLTSPLRYGAFLLYTLRHKMVLTMHDPLPHSSDNGRLNRLHRWVALHAVHYYILLSESLRASFLRTYHLRQERVFVTGLSTYDTLRLVPPLPLPLPERYILFVGSLHPHKGLEYLCEAMRITAEKGETSTPQQETTLVIATHGKPYFDLHAYTTTLPIHLIHRFVSDGELVTLIRGALAVVCPYTDATQSGVIASSLALGTPVIATATGALPDMFTAGRHGIIVPPRDSHALARAISTMTAGKVAATMAANITADFAQSARSWRTIATRTITVYSAVAEQSQT